MWIFIRQDFYQVSVLADPVRSKRFGDVESGVFLQWYNFCELGEKINHKDD